MKHYVYRHIRLDKGTPFYVGKGGYKQRAFTVSQRNPYWTNIYNKTEIKIEIVKYFKTNDEAYEFEQKLIKTYKSYNMCEANFSDGGKGRTGFKQPQKIKDIISEKNSGPNNGMYGAYGNLNPSYGSGYEIVCLNTGEIFHSAMEAGKKLGTTNANKVALGIREEDRGYYFEMLDSNLKEDANKKRKNRAASNKRLRKSSVKILKEVYGVEL